MAGRYETAFRVIGRYIDEQKPHDVFFFEQDGAFVLRLLMAGSRRDAHHLAEFTRDDIDGLVARGPQPPSSRPGCTRPGERPIIGGVESHRR